jgi:membrane protein DedA with SNARE-associated domain
MPFWRFTIYTAVGSVPWVLALTLLGVQVGSKWDEWHKRLEVLDYIVVAGIAVAIAVLVVRRRRGTAHA